MRFIILSLCVLFAAQLAAVERNYNKGKDLIITKKERIYCYVTAENLDGVSYKTNRALAEEQRVNPSLVVDIRYHGMTEGVWVAAMEEKAAGRFADAATRFSALANTDDSFEWKKTYGRYQEGECWELSGDLVKAAAAFGAIVEAVPSSRFAIQGLYRQAMALVKSGDVAGAKAVVTAMGEYGDKHARSGAKELSLAAEAAIAVAGKDIVKAKSLARKVRIKDTTEAGQHWGLFWAATLYDQGEFKDAARAYKSMLDRASTDDQALVGQLRLGLGKSLAQNNDHERALFHLSAFDALPFGSNAQRAEAMYLMAKQLWITSQKVAESEDERRKTYGLKKAAMAREMAQAVFDGGQADAETSRLVSEFLASLPEVEKPAEAEATPAE